VLFRRQPFRLRCPYCGSTTFWVKGGLVRHRNRLPFLTSLWEGGPQCADCGLVTAYQDFVDQHRGWL
jgi:hypothetical protein